MSRIIRAASPSDMADIMLVLAASKEIMRQSGNMHQWVDGYPSESVIVADMEKGGAFVVEDDRRIVGYFAYLPSPEPTYSKIFEGKWLDDTRPYHVVHRIGSYPDVHGIFSAIMDFCFSHETNIRIDTHRDNKIMRHNILKHGFTYCGIIYLQSGDERLAYQRLRIPSVNQDLQQYIEQQIIPLYDHFDKAHQRDHVQMVIQQSMELAKQLDVDVDMVYAIAAYHDVGLCEGRERHHWVSAQMLLADKELGKWFTESQLHTMAEAVEDHRASSDHAPRSIYGRIVAEADRFIEPDTILRRTIQYGLEHYPELDKKGHYERTIQHLHEKYGRHGYLRLWFDHSPNAERLESLRQMIDDEAVLQEKFEKWFLLLQTF